MINSLGGIAAVLETQVEQEAAHAMVETIAIDSRKVTQGALFFALPGEKNDGHNFVPAAFQNGAVAAVVTRPVEGGPYLIVEDTEIALQKLAAYHRSQFMIPVVAVTGSVGKTTTKDLLAALLEDDFKTLKTEGNFNNQLGLPLTLLNLDQTHQAAVVEMGMRAPEEIDLLAGIARPTIGIIVNVAPVHLETMGTVKNIAAAKLEIVPHCSDFVAINGDSQELRNSLPVTNIPVFWFGFGPDCDWRITDVRADGIATSFRLSINNTDYNYILPFPAVHLAENVVSAVGTALAMGVRDDRIQERLDLFRPSAGRLTFSKGLRGSTIIDDTYNANPRSMVAGLQVLSDIGGKRRIAVLGDMFELGSYEEAGYNEVGKKVANLQLEFLVTVGEKSEQIHEGALRSGFSGCYRHFSSPEGAVVFLREMIEYGDLILVKASHGMHLEKVAEALTITD